MPSWVPAEVPSRHLVQACVRHSLLSLTALRFWSLQVGWGLQPLWTPIWGWRQGASPAGPGLQAVLDEAACGCRPLRPGRRGQ